MEKTKVTKDLENKTLLIEREFDAPKAKLWSAYADKDKFVQWWGPQGWETTVSEFNFAAGGRNHYCMKCVDQNQGDFFGQESWGLMEFDEIDEPNSITYHDYFSDADGAKTPDMPALKMIIEFRENNGKTTIATRCIGNSAEEVEKLLAMGMVEGYSSSCERLEKLVQA